MKAFSSRHRRALAALLTAAAVAFGLAAARPRVHGTRVLVAARDLAAGTVLGPRDVMVRVLPSQAVPDGTVARATGRTLSGPVRRGEPFTDARLRSGGPFSGRAFSGGSLRGESLSVGSPGGSPDRPLPDGSPQGGLRSGGTTSGNLPREQDPAATVATPLRLADAAVVRLLRPGDRVDVLAARAEGPPTARTIATAVPVIAVPKPEEATDEGALIVVQTARDQAAALARASVDCRLSVTILGD